jgi:hypothetical protein
MVADFGLNYDGPSVRLFDENVRAPALLEYPPNVFGAKCPLAAEPVKNFAESCVDCLFVCARRHG